MRISVAADERGRVYCAGWEASSGPGVMVGLGLGASGFIAAPVTGYIIQHFGFTWH